MSPERKRDAASQAPAQPRTESYTRFKPRGRRDDQVPPDAGSSPGAHAPSTLPPPPFAAETDVAGHEWWLEAHMKLASNLLCVEPALGSLSESAAHRARVIVEQIAEVRDAMYELYCDAADPRLGDMMADGSALTRHVEQLYAWSERVLDALAAPRDGQIDREGLRAACAGTEHLFNEDLRRSIRDEVNALGVDFSSPVEPLRNLGKDIEQVFTAARALRDSL